MNIGIKHNQGRDTYDGNNISVGCDLLRSVEGRDETNRQEDYHWMWK